MADRKPSHSMAAQFVRRAALNNDQSLVNKYASASREEIVKDLLAAPLDTSVAPGESFKTFSSGTVSWWVDKMLKPSNPLQERMTWFFHTFLTCDTFKISELMVADQLNILRSGCFGNYRELLKKFCSSGALVVFLNANQNSKDTPNENLARELMELFATGTGHYTQDDVKAATVALSGWYAHAWDGHAEDYQQARPPGKSTLNTPNTSEVTFMGETKKWDLFSIIDKLCSMEATATRIASLLWFYFVGTEIPEAKATELGKWWLEQDLEMVPLIQTILTDSALDETYYGRTRTGLEYYCAVQGALGNSHAYDGRDLDLLGQKPFAPPNVAGWPQSQWFNPGSMLGRANFLRKISFPQASLDETLDSCGLYNISDGTLASLKSLDTKGGDTNKLRWLVTLSSPEFNAI